MPTESPAWQMKASFRTGDHWSERNSTNKGFKITALRLVGVYSLPDTGSQVGLCLLCLVSPLSCFSCPVILFWCTYVHTRSNGGIRYMLASRKVGTRCTQFNWILSVNSWQELLNQMYIWSYLLVYWFTLFNNSKNLLAWIGNVYIMHTLEV